MTNCGTAKIEYLSAVGLAWFGRFMRDQKTIAYNISCAQTPNTTVSRSMLDMRAAKRTLHKAQLRCRLSRAALREQHHT
jgi:hypothetical protein